jgi:archaellum biogenesis ATPase FlaH
MFIKQLCWKKKQIPQHLLDFYHTYDQDARTPAFGKYKDSFFKLARSYDQTFLVIDALDECIQNQREQIIDFISDLTKDLPCAKVFVTSRSETDIVEAFTCQQTLTIQIEAKNVVEDIKAFAKGRVDDLVKLNKLKLKDSALKEIIAQTLVTQAEGM